MHEKPKDAEPDKDVMRNVEQQSAQEKIILPMEPNCKEETSIQNTSFAVVSENQPQVESELGVDEILQPTKYSRSTSNCSSDEGSDTELVEWCNYSEMVFVYFTGIFTAVGFSFLASAWLSLKN